MKQYYGELCTKVYEQHKSMADETELNFFLSFINEQTTKVLEPMCGNGRMLIPFLQRGINIEGFDISEPMLEVCRKKAAKLNLFANVYNEKIEQFHSSSVYDLIIIPFGSFSLLPDELIEASLLNMKKALAPTGKLILTVMFKSEDITETDDEWIKAEEININNEQITLYKKVYYDDSTSTQHTTLRYVSVSDGKEVEELMDFPVRMFDEEEFKEILTKNGFTKIIKHTVENGYGKGQHFYAYECSV